MAPPAMPMMSAAPGPTNPEAGVIEARPAIAPVTAPTMLGLPYFIHSMRIHTSAAVAADDMGDGHGHAGVAARRQRAAAR